MLTSRKAEISIEFIIFIGILLLFFIFFLGIIGTKIQDVNETTMFADAQEIANTISYEINIASRMEGYYREFFIPEKLVNGDVYSVEIDTSLRLVKLQWNGKIVMSNLLTDNISGDITPGINRIRNEEGLIIIES